MLYMISEKEEKVTRAGGLRSMDTTVRTAPEEPQASSVELLLAQVEINISLTKSSNRSSRFYSTLFRISLDTRQTGRLESKSAGI